jgi:hypothetical protein
MTTIHDFERTALAPRGEEPTSAYAWASSPLGDPTDSAADLPYGHEFPPDPIVPAAKPKSINKTMVAAGVIGLIGAGTALGIALFGGSSQPHHMAVASGSIAVPAAAPASAAPAPAVAAPDNGPVPAPVVTPPANGPASAPVVTLPAPAAVVAPPPDNPPPPADLSTPPDAAPPGPVVIVNALPPPAIWVPVQPPQLPPPSPPKLPPPPPPKLPAPPKLTPLPPPPSLCLPPHHLVQGVCK